MVALQDKPPLPLNTALRARGDGLHFVAPVRARCNSSNRTEFHRLNYDSCIRLESCARDPIGYEDGQNLIAAYFVPNSVDPEGTIVPVLVGIGVGIGIIISPEIVNAPGPGDPLYPPVGPIGTNPELIVIGGAIGAGVGIGARCCIGLGSRKAAADLSAMRAEFARMMENKLAWERIADSQKPGPLKALAKLEKDQLEARMVALAKKIQDLRDRFCK